MIISAHVCHPSLANDNLSGIVVATELAKTLLALDRRRYTYRFLFAPGTIGSIVWLSQNPDVWPRIRHGLVLTGLGGGGRLVYKQTRHGSRPIDRIAGQVVGRGGGEIRAYSPYGYDERQFNSVGFDLPVGRLSRTPHGEYPEYHTSADNLDFVTRRGADRVLRRRLADHPDPGAGPALPQPQPVRRAAARQARPVSEDRRPGGE